MSNTTETKQCVGKNLLDALKAVDMAVFLITGNKELADEHATHVSHLLDVKRSIKRVLNADFDELAIRRAIRETKTAIV